MRELIKEEINAVSGGDLICTAGTNGFYCEGSLTDWGDAAFGAYDNAVSTFTDLFEWIDNSFFGGN